VATSKKSKKPAKSSKARVITGGIKKLSRAKQVYLAAVLVLFVSTVGYSAQGYLQLRDYQAQAAGYTPVVLKSYAVIYACKRYITSAYGGVYRVGITAQKKEVSTDVAVTGLQARTHRGSQGTIVDSGTNMTWLGAYSGVTVNASAYYRDTVAVRLKVDGTWRQMTAFTPATANIATCP
jgi:hypothetical protein